MTAAHMPMPSNPARATALAIAAPERVADVDRRRRADRERHHEHEGRVVERDLVAAGDDRAHAAHHQRRRDEQAALREDAAGDRRADARQLAQHAQVRLHRCARRSRSADRRDAGACATASRRTSATSEIAVATPQPTAPSCGMPNLPYMKTQLPNTLSARPEKADVHDRLGAPEALARVAQREERQQRRHAPRDRVHVADGDRQDLRRDADRAAAPSPTCIRPVTSSTDEREHEPPRLARVARHARAYRRRRTHARRSATRPSAGRNRRTGTDGSKRRRPRARPDRARRAARP